MITNKQRIRSDVEMCGNAQVNNDLTVGKNVEVDGKLKVNSASDIVTGDGTSLGGLPITYEFEGQTYPNHIYIGKGDSYYNQDINAFISGICFTTESTFLGTYSYVPKTMGTDDIDFSNFGAGIGFRSTDGIQLGFDIYSDLNAGNMVFTFGISSGDNESEFTNVAIKVYDCDNMEGETNKQGIFTVSYDTYQGYSTELSIISMYLEQNSKGPDKYTPHLFLRDLEIPDDVGTLLDTANIHNYIPTYYRHTITLSKDNASFTFTAVTKDNTVIDSLTDLFTKLGNTDIAGFGVNDINDTKSLLTLIHVGTSATDSTFKSVVGETITLATAGFTTVTDSVTTVS